MRKAILILLFFLPILACRHTQQITPTELKEIMGTLEESDLTKSPALIVAEIEEQDTRSVAFSDTTFYAAYCKTVNEGVWTKEIFKNANIVSQHTLNDKYSMSDMPEHYRLSMPFFNKERNLFVIYYQHHCGSQCTEKSVRMYRKTNGKWQLVKHYFRSVIYN